MPPRSPAAPGPQQKLREGAEVRDIRARLAGLEYYRHSELPDLAGDFVALDPGQVSDRQRAEEVYGLIVTAEGHGNRLYINRSGGPFTQRPEIVINGDDNVLIIDRAEQFIGRLDLTGSGNLAVFCEGAFVSVRAAIEGDSTLIWGKNAFAWGTRIGAHGGAILTVGDGCLMAFGVCLLTSDYHSLVDLETMSQINFPGDIFIEPHVWIGEQAFVTKSVRLGRGSVIGAHSVVTSDVPSCECWAGSPARLIRRGVSWVRSHPASAEDLEGLAATLGRDLTKT